MKVTSAMFVTFKTAAEVGGFDVVSHIAARHGFAASGERHLFSRWPEYETENDGTADRREAAFIRELRSVAASRRSCE